MPCRLIARAGAAAAEAKIWPANGHTILDENRGALTGYKQWHRDRGSHFAFWMASGAEPLVKRPVCANDEW